MMKANISLAALILAVSTAFVPVSAKADPLFGNTPTGQFGGSLYYVSAGNYSYGEIFGFTANEDLTFSSITMLLTNYSSSISLSLFSGTNPASFGPFGLSQVANFTSPSPNNGSPADFTFSLNALYGPPLASVTLSAGETYWVIADSGQSSGVDWALGTTPTGGATYVATYLDDNSYVNTIFFEPVPFFTLNPVPEPSTLALLGISAAAFFVRRRRS
jgi:hypothetical protein